MKELKIDDMAFIMNKINGSISRRNFLKTAGALGAGSLLLPLDSLTATKAESNSKESKSKVVLTRPFGKTGADVPILCLGHIGYSTSNHLLKQALNRGGRFLGHRSNLLWR